MIPHPRPDVHAFDASRVQAPAREGDSTRFALFQ